MALCNTSNIPNVLEDPISSKPDGAIIVTFPNSLHVIHDVVTMFCLAVCIHTGLSGVSISIVHRKSSPQR
jgi:hypothetical protein